MYENRIPTIEELKEMSQADICQINPAELTDLENVHINMKLPKSERVLRYIQQVRNPYCVSVNGIAVKVSFLGKTNLDDCLKSILTSESAQ